MAKKESRYTDIASGISLQTQESILEVGRKGKQIFIGIPFEDTFKDNRIPLTPVSVKTLVNNGHHVVVESKAGNGAKFSDKDFTEAGARVVYDTKQVFEADIILKIAPLVEKQIDLLKPHQTIISAINLPTLKEKHLVRLMDKKVTALALEYFKEDAGTFPIVRAMSEIAGHSAIMIASEYLNNINGGKGILLGGVSGNPPTNVVILGAGVVGEFAARTAIGLGAEVKVFDNNIYKLMRLQNNIGRRLFTSVFNPEVLSRELETAMVAVGAIHSESGRTPTVVTEEMVSRMKPGAVIIDVSIDQGGCFETSEITTHDKPTFVKHDIIHYCVPNIASRVARTASYAISNILMHILIKSADLGGFENLLYTSASSRHGVYIYKGTLTNKYLSQLFNMKYTDLDLLFAANI